MEFVSTFLLRCHLAPIIVRINSRNNCIVIEGTVGQVSCVIGRGLMTPSSDRIALLYREWLTRECEVLKRELSACRGDSLVAVTCRVETGTEASWRELLSRLTSSGKFFTIVDNGGTWTACRVYVIIAPLFVVWVSFRSFLLKMALTEQNWWRLHFPSKFPPISGRTWSLVGKFLQDIYTICPNEISFRLVSRTAQLFLVGNRIDLSFSKI